MSELHQEFVDRLQGESNRSNEAEVDESIQEPIDGDPAEESDEVGIDSADNTEGELDPESEADEEYGDADDGEDPEVGPEYKELQEKYKSLEQEFSRVTANRKEIETSLDTAKAETIRYKHELEDKYTEASQIADYFAGMANQQLQQLQQVNPANLSQEQFTQYQQALTQAQQQAQQFHGYSQQIQEQLAQTKEAQKKREAEIARERLKARIPDWSAEKYNALGETAQEFGYSPEEFFDTTDYRLMLLLNEVQTSKDAVKAVESRSKKTKQNPPKNRASRNPERNEKGQFHSAKKAWQEARPGTKGAFAQMKAAELARERKR